MCKQSYDIESFYDSRLIAKQNFSSHGNREWFNFAWFEKGESRLLEICCVGETGLSLISKERSLLSTMRLGIKKESLSKKYE